MANFQADQIVRIHDVLRRSSLEQGFCNRRKLFPEG
jgi:hypothetical protein